MPQPERPAGASKPGPTCDVGCWPAALVSLGVHALGGLLVCLFAVLTPSAPRERAAAERVTPGLRETAAGCVVVESPAPPTEGVASKSPAPLPPAPPAAPHLLDRAPLGPVPVGDVPAGSPSVESGGPAGEGGTGAVTAFFRVPAYGRRIVYVIDRSASMGPNGGLAAARRELLASLRRLPADARFQVIAYNRTAEPLHFAGQPEMLPASIQNVRDAMLRIEALDAEGGTDHLAALRRALALEPDVVYFLTDADDLSLQQVQAVTRRAHARAVIHSIDLSPLGRDGSPLAVLARESGGQYRSVAVVP